MLRKIFLGLLALLAPLGVLTVTAGSASAAGDTRPCVTRGEYRSIYEGDTVARVKRVFDTNGVVLTSRSYVWFEGDWIWDEDVQEYVWDDYAIEHTDRDVVRAYKKCGTWGQAGRVGIDFDNYSDGRTGMRAILAINGHAQWLADYIDALYDEVDSGDYLTAPAPVKPPNGVDEKKIPQAPDGRRIPMPEAPPAG